MKMFIVAGALVAFAGAAVAGDEPFPRRFKPDQYSQVVSLIEDGMKAGGTYAATADEQSAVRAELAALAKVLEGNERLADLDDAEKAAIDKHRDAINTLLADNAKPAEQEVAQAPAKKRRRSPTDHLQASPEPVYGN